MYLSRQQSAEVEGAVICGGHIAIDTTALETDRQSHDRSTISSAGCDKIRFFVPHRAEDASAGAGLLHLTEVGEVFLRLAGEHSAPTRTDEGFHRRCGSTSTTYRPPTTKGDPPTARFDGGTRTVIVGAAGPR